MKSNQAWIWVLGLLLSNMPAQPQDVQVPELWVINTSKQSPAEQFLSAAIQGLANRNKVQVWVQSDGMNRLILEQLKAEGTQIHPVSDPWALLDAFPKLAEGSILYKLETPSVNAATTLCGLLNAIPVDETLAPIAEKHGLKVLRDARDLDFSKVYSEFKERLAKSILIEQDEKKVLPLRDFAVSKCALVYHAGKDEEITRIVKESGPETYVFGWGKDEKQIIKRVSEGGGSYLAADWSFNLSALEHLKVIVPQHPKGPRPVPAKDGERIVAFVMSDGDNIQFMAGGFATSKAFWANPHRGEFNMNWEMAPKLAYVAPRAIKIIYDSAHHETFFDDFVAGPSGAGYCFPNYLPDRNAYAKQTAQAMQNADLNIVSILNSGGEMAQTKELLEQPAVMGVIYKDYAPYNAQKGAIYWHAGKPCVSYRYLLWEGLKDQNPEGLSKAISQLPANPLKDQNSYALINVHAWSYKSIGGPMEAVKQTIDKLPPNTRVVTATEFFTLLRENFGTPVK